MNLDRTMNIIKEHIKSTMTREEAREYVKKNCPQLLDQVDIFYDTPPELDDVMAQYVENYLQNGS